ncbi:hypothetical protein GCM10023334_049210 [Nonomuraea thailandensis]
MADDVVQLRRDPGPLGVHGRAGGPVPFAFQQPPLLGQHGPVAPPRTHEGHCHPPRRAAGERQRGGRPFPHPIIFARPAAIGILPRPYIHGMTPRRGYIPGGMRPRGSAI